MQAAAARECKMLIYGIVAFIQPTLRHLGVRAAHSFASMMRKDAACSMG